MVLGCNEYFLLFSSTLLQELHVTFVFHRLVRFHFAHFNPLSVLAKSWVFREGQATGSSLQNLVTKLEQPAEIGTACQQAPQHTQNNCSRITPSSLYVREV
jgi:hypothetical protein